MTDGDANYNGSDSNKYENSEAFEAGDICGLHINMDTSSMSVYRNGRRLGWLFQNNKNLKNCAEVYPTI